MASSSGGAGSQKEVLTVGLPQLALMLTDSRTHLAAPGSGKTFPASRRACLQWPSQPSHPRLSLGSDPKAACGPRTSLDARAQLRRAGR